VRLLSAVFGGEVAAQLTEGFFVSPTNPSTTLRAVPLPIEGDGEELARCAELASLHR